MSTTPNRCEAGHQEIQEDPLKHRIGQDMQNAGGNENSTLPNNLTLQGRLDDEGSPEHGELRYPKGIKLAVVALSLGLALFLFGLVGHLFAITKMAVANGSNIPGLDNSSHRSAQHHQ